MYKGCNRVGNWPAMIGGGNSLVYFYKDEVRRVRSKKQKRKKSGAS